MFNHLKMKLTRMAKVQNVCNQSRPEFFLVDNKRADQIGLLRPKSKALARNGAHTDPWVRMLILHY
ncbi:hypothetical protein DPMN_025970 [Dreissena polymorpha]|uniref:Uncharacterized protein n=1 Tax=Dreissena polymorpha TaxID=45954 RepID=A0A9D4RCB3_DREPO|nr:hypothetical protein DPMN_025970 [Dreissena polymorpha]